MTLLKRLVLGEIRGWRVKVLVSVLGVVALLLATGCNTQTESSVETSYNESAVLKVSILQSGTLLVDGETATIEALDEALTQLDEVNGVVWYYRENGQGEPPAIVTQVLDTIVAHERPISFSSKPDFSDVIDLNTGQSQPRN
jgi:hypothetical protein